jgi:hypothetical protein
MTVSTLKIDPNNKVFTVNNGTTGIAVDTTKPILILRLKSGNSAKKIYPLDVHVCNLDAAESLLWTLHRGTTFSSPPTYGDVSSPDSASEFAQDGGGGTILAWGVPVASGYVGPASDFRAAIPAGIFATGSGQQVLALRLQTTGGTPDALAALVWRETP